MIDLYLSLGSNIGDRLANINAALDLLDREFPHGRKRLSEIMETRAWGFEGGDFLNCVVIYSIALKREPIENQAIEILETVKGIERKMGRKNDLEFDSEGKRIYHSRIIDIDILFIGSRTVDLPDLKIPHPLIAERDFVTIPLRQVAGTSLRRAFPALFKNK